VLEPQSGRTVVLSYPSSDPSSTSEYLGLLAGSSAAPSSAAPADSATSGTGITEVCAATGVDIIPRGRSFHHTRFVQNLRAAAMAEKNVTAHWGIVRSLVAAKDLAETVERVNAQAKATNASSAPAFGGPAATYASRLSFAKDPERVVGIVWQDAEGRESLVTARLTIVANGMFSIFRKELHQSAPVKVSHFCGLVLKHPPFKTPLPYPNRGHVLMIDPNPVLFYQIASTDTRVLVDVPAAEYDKGVKNYFLNVVAPQLPEALRTPFLEALETQEIKAMPCMALSGSPPRKAG
jgi:squalene monooxygenase